MNKNSKTTRGKKFTNLEKAYIAGLFDGEGCVNIYKTDTPKVYEGGQRKKFPRYELSIMIYNCDREVLEWIYNRLGGYLQIRHRYKKPEQVELGKWKKSYCWKLSSNQAMNFLKSVKRYLRIKKKQAELAIRFQKKRSKKRNRFRPITEEENEFFMKCWKEMKKLNKKGL